MVSAKRDPVMLTVDERLWHTKMRWKVLHEDVRILDIEHKPDEIDADAVKQAIAEHFSVGVDDIEYVHAKVRPNSKARVRLIPASVIVHFPAAAEKPTCEHVPGVTGCELPDCDGTPPLDTPMDRDIVPVAFTPVRGEYGNVTEGREIMRAVHDRTGLPVVTGHVANNGWSDTRWGTRRIDGLIFDVDGGDTVRLLTYEARGSELDPRLGTFAAVYVGDECLAGALDLERNAWMWRQEAITAIVQAVQKRHDERALQAQSLTGWWRLKNPPVGYRVDSGRHGIVEVVEASTNGGVTLRTTDEGGAWHWIDRAESGWWRASAPTPPAGEDSDTEERPSIAALVHVRLSSPTVVSLGNGREGLRNPTWCGIIDLPEDAKAWHVYGLKPELVTCPVCFHLFTCPWAQVKNRVGEHCDVCAHIFYCDDATCNPAKHPGFVPAPDSTFDRAAAVGAVVERIHQAIADGDYALADELVEAGENYEPSHAPGYDSWNDLAARVWRLDKQAKADVQSGEEAKAQLTESSPDPLRAVSDRRVGLDGAAQRHDDREAIATHVANIPGELLGELWGELLDEHEARG